MYLYVKCKKPRNMIERLPIWYREDLLANTISGEIDQIKLDTYYKMLSSYPIQPIQVWSEANLENKSWHENLTKSGEIDLGKGETPFSPRIILDFNRAYGVFQGNPIKSVLIHANGFGYKITHNFYPGDVLTFNPKRGVLLNDVEVPESKFEKVPELREGHPQCTSSLAVEFSPTEYTKSIGVIIDDDFYPHSKNVYGRFYTKKEFPLREVTLYDENGKIVQHHFFKEHKKPPLALFVEEKGTQLQKFYFGVKYYGLEGELFKGFPQQIQPRTWNYTLKGNKIVYLDNEADDAVLEYEINFGFGKDEEIETLARLEPINGLTIKSKNTIAHIVSSFYPGDILKLNKKGEILLNQIPIGEHQLKGSEAIEFLLKPTKYTPSIDVTITQDDYYLDKKYGINKTLDNVVESYGLKRRKYRDDLLPADGARTYPQYYLYNVEQDFYLESRLLSDYFYQKDYSDIVKIKDKDKNVLAEITQKAIGSRFIDITWYAGTGVTEYYVKVTSYEPNRIDIEESLSAQSLSNLIKEINKNSSLIEAKLIEDGVLVEGNSFISLKGIFQMYGGLSSEIYHQIGCLPVISDVSDHLLIWNKDKWNSGKMWGGEVDGTYYLPGLYYLSVPLKKVPSNIILPSKKELDAIIKKYKTLGSTVIGSYSYEESACNHISATREHPLVKRRFRVGFAPFNVTKTDALKKLCISAGVSMDSGIEQHLENITSGGAYVVPSVLQDDAFDAISEDGEELFTG